MKKINNITVNLKEEFINFYEWNKTDRLLKIKYINAIKVNNETYYDIIKSNILAEEFACGIYLFANDFDAICIKFNDQGKSIQRSKLSINEENYVLDELYREKPYKFKYSILEKINYSFFSRENNIKMDTIKNFISSNKDNPDLLEFLSYEMTNKNIKDFNKLKKYLDEVNIEKIDALYDIIKLIEINV